MHWQQVRETRLKRLAARRAVARAVASGKLFKPSTCERCGGTPTRREMHGHHHDYDRPLDVRWLCLSCHAAEHTEATRVSETARQARLKDRAFCIAI